MLYKRVLAALAAVALAAAPILGTHGISYASTTIHGITFPTNTNGCSGPLVPVYGSAAMKTYILTAAKDYCTNQLAHGVLPGNAIDVEYASGGEACNGVDWAADFNDANELGASTVFAPACTGSFARPASKISDTNIGVNVEESIAQCPGANDLQGGDVNPPAPDNQCLGNGSGAAGSKTFPAPNDESVDIAQLLWSTSLGDWAQAGGTAGNAPLIQQRTVGAGDRATWCLNIFGPGNDSACVNNASTPGGSSPGPAATTSVMLNDVCGNPYASGGAAPPVDAPGTIGYASRAGVLVDPRQPLGGTLPVAGCGIVAINGHTGWNRTCNPTSPSGYAGTNPESGAATCNGDLEVATGNYKAWGYAHLDVNVGASSSSPANQFIQFVLANEDSTLVQAQGFMRDCQMTVLRSVDAGPVSAAPGASC